VPRRSLMGGWQRTNIYGRLVTVSRALLRTMTVVQYPQCKVFDGKQWMCLACWH